MADTAVEDFEGAVESAIRGCEFMPTAYELRKHAKQARAKAEGRIQVGAGEWVADPWRQQPRAITGQVAPGAAPPLSTFAECMASCDLNMEQAANRANNANTATPEGVKTKREALDDVAHWRSMREWYRRRVQEGRGDEQINLGGFAPPAMQTRNSEAPVAPEPHWSEGREVGADDVEDVA